MGVKFLEKKETRPVKLDQFRSSAQSKSKSTNLDVHDQIVHLFDELRDGQVLEHLAAKMDDLAHFGLVEGEENGRNALQNA